MGQIHRYRFDEIRRLACLTVCAHGVGVDRAPAFINGLLWFDAANAPKDGIESLPAWLAAIDRGEINPQSEGSIALEFTGTAVLDGKNGPAPIVLGKAARIAQGKAREVGIGIVRVMNVGGRATPAPIAFDIAIGPMVGVIQGPGPSWTVAVPAMGSVPAVFDTGIGNNAASPPAWSIQRLPAWTFPFAGVGDWLITAYSVAAFEPLASFHERIDAQLRGKAKVAGEVRPEDWQAARAQQFESGILLSDRVDAALRERAEAAGIEFPSPIAE